MAAVRVWPTALLGAGAGAYAVKNYENTGLGDFIRVIRGFDSGGSAPTSSGVSIQMAGAGRAGRA